jgi:hypothetical protein
MNIPCSKGSHVLKTIFRLCDMEWVNGMQEEFEDIKGVIRICK